MEDLRIPVHLHVERSTGIVRLTHGKTGVELMKMRCDLSAFGTFTRLDPSGNYEADNYWIGVKPDDILCSSSTERLYGNWRKCLCFSGKL